MATQIYRIFCSVRLTFPLLKSKGKCVRVLWGECRLRSYPRSQNSKRDCCFRCAAIPLVVLASEIQNILFLVFLLQKLGASCGLVRLIERKMRCIEKENDEIGAVASSKGRVQLVSAPSKSFAERSCPKTPLVGRTADITPAASQSVRKEKKSSTKKATETANRVENMVPEGYPEMENLFSYDPLDFESFEVPEDHRLSHMPLTGVPLMVFENASDRFANTISAPAKEPSISWGYDTLQSTLDFLTGVWCIAVNLQI
uniref:Securin n=1 Tax=Podarcis muralis TaxID=64176 RepID=A0A670JCW3_PODMU